MKCGYYMDSLTSIRIINLHRLMPRVIPIIQKMFFLGRLLSFRGGDEEPTLFNRDMVPFTRMDAGGCRVFTFDEDGDMYAMG